MMFKSSQRVSLVICDFIPAILERNNIHVDLEMFEG